MFKGLLIISLLCFTLPTWAQNLSISGKITDENKQGAIGASVILLKGRDSSLVKGTTTDLNGNFVLEEIQGNRGYLIKILYLGYQTAYKFVRVQDESLNTGEISLKQSSTNLKEVTVEAKQILATQQGDTTSFNANAFKVNKDATAEDLVTKMPGVNVVDGKVQAQGEDVKQVLVDGKQFFGDDANAVLKNLPAEIIDKVQVFDKKSDQSLFTGFDDGNAQKTINIVTKQQFRNGTFGRVYGGYGYEDKYKAGGVLNYFKGSRRLTILGQSNNINEQNFSSEDLAGVMSSSGGGGGRGRSGRGGPGGFQGSSDNFLVNSLNGINTTSSFGINYTDKLGKKTDVTASYFFNWTNNNSLSTMHQQYVIGNNNGLIYTEDNNAKSDNLNNRLSLKIESKLDSLNSIIFQPKFSFQNNTNNKSLFGDNTKSDALISDIENKTKANTFSYNISLPILYRHSFAKRGRTFSFNVAPTLSKTDGNNSLYTLNNYYSTPFMADTLDQESITTKNGNSVRGSVDYTEPLTKNGVILVNYVFNYTDNYSSKKTYDYNPFLGSYAELDSTLTNVFGNTYQSHAGSLGYRFQKEKFNFSLSTAYQWAELSKEQEIPGTYKMTKNFESVLPSAQFQYKFGPKNNLRIFYRTNNNAPSIDQLQDVINNSNSLQLSTGNPNLKQDFQQSLNIRYSGVNTTKATSFFFLLGGNYSNSYIGNSTLIADQDTTVYNQIFLQKGSQIVRPINIDGYYSLRSFINYTFPLSKIKTNLSFNISGNYNNVPGVINDQINYAKTASGGLGLVLSSNISEKIDFTISSNSSYSNINNTLQTSSNSTYFQQNSSLKINLNPWKGLILQSQYTNTYYNGLSSSYNQNISLWVGAIGYKFLKNKQAEIKLSVYDILNQNNNISRTNTDSYIQDSRTNALNRYYLLTFTYNFRKYLEKKEGDNPDKKFNKQTN